MVLKYSDSPASASSVGTTGVSQPPHLIIIIDYFDQQGLYLISHSGWPPYCPILATLKYLQSCCLALARQSLGDDESHGWQISLRPASTQHMTQDSVGFLAHIFQ